MKITSKFFSIFHPSLSKGDSSQVARRKGNFQAPLRNCITNKKAQEEMVGFALILIIVAIILIVLLAAYIKKPQSETIRSPEANSFIQSFLQYTTACEEPNLINASVQKLISKCQKKEICSYNKDPCKVLNDSLKGIISESWKVGEKNPTKGYSLVIFTEMGQVLNMSKGVVTNNYKGGLQDFSTPDGELTTILFNAYS
jgi:hypothetical protein